MIQHPRQGGLLPPASSFPAFDDPNILQEASQFVHITFGLSILASLAASILAALDGDLVLFVAFAGLGLIASGLGTASIFRHQGRLIFSPVVRLIPVVTTLVCLLVGTFGLAVGRSELVGDGQLRSRWFPVKKPAVAVVHDSGVPVKVGAWEIQVKSARIVTDDQNDRRLKIVVELRNASTTTKLGRVSLGSARLTLRDDLGNRYSKISDDPLEVPPQEKNGKKSASVYPGERSSWFYLYEPPIEKAEHLNLTLHVPTLTSSTGLAFRIPKASWTSPSEDREKR